jgi:hypothetical protein
LQQIEDGKLKQIPESLKLCHDKLMMFEGKDWLRYMLLMTRDMKMNFDLVIWLFESSVSKIVIFVGFKSLLKKR